MKNSISNPLRLSASMLIACAALFNFDTAHAATSTWTGSTNVTWATTGNWNTATPTASDIALWDSSSTSNLSITLGAPASVLGLTVTSPSGAVTLSGSTLTIGTSGIDMSAATQNLTISSSLTIGAGNQVWNVASGRTLTLNTGTFTRTAGATLNLQLSGTVAASMTGLANAGSTGIIGPWATVGSGTSTTYATLSGGNIIAYTTGSNVSSASLVNPGTANDNYNLTTSSTTAYGAASRTANTIRNTVGATTLTFGNGAGQINLVVNGLMNAGTGLLTVNGGGSNVNSGIMVGSNNNRELVVNAANASISLGHIIDNTGGASSVTINASGANTVTLSASNSFTGGLTVNSGILTTSTNLALGGAGGTAGAVTLNGGTLSTTAGITNTHAVTIGAAGGTINVNGAGQYFFNTANTLLGSGQLTVTGSGTLTTTGAGNLRLAQTNTYSGNAIMQSGGIIEYGIAGAVGAGTTFTINNQGELAVQNGVALPNNITVNGGTNSVLSFENGTTGNFSGNITLNANATIGLRDWYNNATVRSGTISGVISGTGGLSVNSGSGTGGVLTLTNSNNFSGGTTITSAVVAANNGGAFGSGLITVGTGNSGQQVQLANGVNVSNALTINGGGVAGQGIVYEAAASGTATYSGAINITGAAATGGHFASNTGGVLNVTGPITSSVPVTIRSGIVVLSNTASNYSSIQLQSGTTQLGATNAIPIAATVDIGTVSPGAVLDLAGFNQTLAGLTKNTQAATVTNSLTSSTSTLTTTGTSTYNGVIQNGAGVTALTVSSGALTLGGSNTYSGATSINGGKLVATGAIANSAIAVTSGTLDGTGTVGAVTVANNSANVVANGNGSTGALTLGSLSFNGAARANLIISGTQGLAVTGALATTPANGQVIVSATSAAWVIGLTDLISYGSFGGAASDFTVGTISGLTGRQTANSIQLDGNNVAVNIIGDNPVWSGTNGNIWTTSATNDNSGTPTWATKNGHTATNFWANDAVEFNDTYNLGAGNVAVTATNVVIHGGNVSPVTTTFNNSNVDYKITSDDGSGIASGLLVKSGTGKATITTTNTYTGATTINNGTLQIGDGTTDGSIGTTSNIVDNGTLVYNRVGSFTYGGVISGTGTLTKSGTGTQILTATNTYSGGTTINAGTLQITQTGTAAIANVGTFNLNGGNFQINSSVNNFAYAPTISVTADSTFSSVGSGAINYTGNLTGASNVLTVNSTSAAGRIYINGTVTGITQFNVTAGVMGFDLGVGNQGGLAPVNVSNGASLYIANASNTLFNNITLNGTGLGGVGALFQEGNGSPTLSGSITLASDSSIGGSGTSGGVIVSGIITGSGALTKVGTSKYIFSASNNYTGTTAINGGVLSVNDANALAGGGNITFGGGTLQFTGNNTQDYSARIVNSAGAISIDTNSQTVTFASSLASSNTGGFTASGGGTLILSGSNNYSGNTTVTGGILSDQNNNALGTSGTVNITNRAGGFQLQGGIAIPGTVTFLTSQDGTGAVPYAIDNVSGNNTINGTMTLTSGGGFTVVQSDSGTLTLAGNISPFSGVGVRTLILQGASTGANTVSGVISNTGTNVASVTKTGAGTWTLAGANTYTGATTGSAGTLNLTGTLAGTSGVTVTGGTFNESSTGVISGAATLSASGGTAILAGANTFSGKVTINTGGVVSASSLNIVTGGAASSNLGAPTTIGNGTIDMTGAGGNGTLIYTGTGEITDRVINLAAGLNGGLSAILDQSGSGLLKFVSNFTATGGQTHTLVLQGSTAGTGEIASAIVDNSTTNKTSLTKNGSGKWTLSGANTYTGATTVNNGTLQMNSVNATSASVTINNGGTLALNIGDALGFTTGKNLVTITSGGTVSNITSASRVTLWNGLTMTGGTLTSTGTGDAAGAYSLSGTVTATSDAGGIAATMSGGPISLQNQNIANGTATFNVTRGVATPASDLTVSANLVPFTTSGTNTGLTKTGNGIMTLSGSNTYTGATNVNAGTLAFDVSETLTGGLNVATSGTTVLTAHTGGAANVKVLDITGLTISGTTPFIGDGGKDLGGLASPAPVPEPGTIGLLAVGAIGGLLLRRRNRKSGS